MVRALRSFRGLREFGAKFWVRNPLLLKRTFSKLEEILPWQFGSAIRFALSSKRQHHPLFFILLRRSVSFPVRYQPERVSGSRTR